MKKRQLQIGKKKMKPSEYPELMLKALVSKWDKHPGELSEPSLGFDIWGLAVEAGMISRNDIDTFREHWLGGDSTFEMHGVVVGDIFAAVDVMRQRGWIQTIKTEFDGKPVYAYKPTIAGSEHGLFLNRSYFYRKCWYPLKGDVRAIVVSVITSLIITVATFFVLRALD
jgi:hypothetical protein